MIESIKEQLENKRVAIFGFGREGRSSYKFFRSNFPGAVIGIIDNNQAIKTDPELLGDPNISFHLGDIVLEQICNYDLVIKAPGIPSHVFPAGFDISRISSQTNLFLQQYASQVIGVTGTKGKSTTSSLIHHILSQSGVHSMLLGNIGLPPFEGIPEITPATVIVMELSSHQLEYLRKSPHIAVLLNIFQEHLDHYPSYDSYQQAKMNIGNFQSGNDYFIYCFDNELLSGLVQKLAQTSHQVLPYSMNKTEISDGIFREDTRIKLRTAGVENCIFDSRAGLTLKGEHNFSNVMAAAAACSLTGLSREQIEAGVRTFKGLDHRLEYVGEYEGVIYYNDSIATIPEATIQAVKTLSNVDTLILGGFDRGIDYSILYPFLIDSMIGNIIFIGEAGARMKQELLRLVQVKIQLYDADNYSDVVSIAKRVTTKGKICLLSPAASSYDMFKNFEHRGDIYKKNVRSQGSPHSN